MTDSTINPATINVQEALENMMLVLNPKEKEVLVRRFSLNNKPKETLEKIWQKFSITRERVRQIENNALNKLRRVVKSSNLRFINKEAERIIIENWWAIPENELMAELLNKLWKEKWIEWNMIKLSLNVDTEIVKSDKTNTHQTFWRFVEIKLSDIQKITNSAYKILKKKWAIVSDEWIVSSITMMNLFQNRRPTPKFILSSLKIDSRIHKNEEWWGLMEWRFVNPKSIKDKAIIILKKEWKPLHFIDIANWIWAIWFSKKNVTTQAVHNELIRYDDFVLVWRWMYWLKEWWMISWSVADVIERIIKENRKPMKKQDIVDEVQKVRDVKIWTISLNLQKNEKFVRVWRATYTLKSLVK